MDLIVKPTELCNFACTFCSSPNITDEDNKTVEVDRIYRFLDRFPETSTIIINGGDPLMVDPKYYFQVLDYLEKKGMDKCRISFTSNLWDFWKKPDKWTPLFKHPMVGVNTSFNYGDSRRITNSRVFLEEDFIKISDLMLERVGYRPDFISVIDYETAPKAIDNVRLAKKLGVECKLNWTFSSGRAGNVFPIGLMYKIYAEIYKEGLGEWEYNVKQILGKENGMHATCPISRNCQSGIRNIQPDGYNTCGSFGDDHEHMIDFEAEMAGEKIDPFKGLPQYIALKEECLTCPSYNYCNGCKKMMRDLKKHDKVEESCKAMKEAWQILPRQE